MAGFREQLSDPDLVRFYDYWTTLRGQRPMPSRRDIDPLQIPPGYLPDIMLIEVSHVLGVEGAIVAGHVSNCRSVDISCEVRIDPDAIDGDDADYQYQRH
jgi:hypothetical protein